MKQFLCVCYYDAEAFAKFTPADFEKLGRLCAPHDQALKASGKVRMIGSLGFPNEFKTLRVKNGQVQLAAGPYAETKEPWGAFFLVEAADIDEAVNIARLHPGTHIGELSDGGIEVRPIEAFETL
jgi:hypothetical protein